MTKINKAKVVHTFLSAKSLSGQFVFSPAGPKVALLETTKKNHKV